MSENIQPLHDLVVVSVKTEEKSGSFVLAKAADPDHGTVVAVGLGKILPSGAREEMPLEAGQDVIFAKDIIRRDPQDDGTVWFWMKLINVIGIKE